MKNPIIMAGPCAIESREQTIKIAERLKILGVEYLRGGAWKYRTDPKSFQGLENEALEYLALAKKETNLKVVTEVLSEEYLSEIAKVADVLQIGSRNMFNTFLLKKIAEKFPEKDILLKRNFAATAEEFLKMAEYLKQNGHKAEVYLCERGIRTFANEEYDRFTLDIAIIPYLQAEGYKVIIDPSHAAGKADIVENLAYSGIAAGADGLIMEVKLDNAEPKSDAKQAIAINKLEEIIHKSNEVYKILYSDSNTQIIRGVKESLNQIPNHTNPDFLERTIFPCKNKKIAIHYINIKSNNANIQEYTKIHSHPYEEVNLILSQKPNELSYKIFLEGEEHIVQSPSTIIIPAHTPHAQNAIKGEGFFICIQQE